MARENEILTAIDDLDGFTFQKFARRLLQKELYPDLNPLPEQDDLGQDARSELPVTELPQEENEGKQLSFAISKTSEWSKVRKDCDRCEEEGHDFDVLVFVTSGKVTGDKRKVWGERVQNDYGWELKVRDRTWFSDIATKPEHEQLVDQKLSVPPLNGDYHRDILKRFREFTEDNLSSTESSLPHIDHNIERERTDTLLKKLTEGEDVILTGEAGVGKSGVLGEVVRQWNSTPVLFLDARVFSEVSNQTQLRQEFDLNGRLSDAIKRVGQHDGCLIVVDQLDNVSGTRTAQLFVDLLTEAAGDDNVSVLAATREWYLKNSPTYSNLVDGDSFEQLELGELDESTVQEVLNLAGISGYSDELIILGKNLLNLSIIMEVHFQTPSGQLDYTQIRSQVELWKRFIDTIPEREREGAEWDRESGFDVRRRAVELARQGLKEGSRVIPTSIGFDRAEERLISRNILRRERGERYSFRHQELQDYLYAWNAVQRKGWRTHRPVLEEIDERAAAGVFRWMARIWKKEDQSVATEFVEDALASDGLGFYAAASLIDEIIDWGPNGSPDDLLDPIIDRIEERDEISRYFYTNLSSPHWERILNQQDRFEKPVTSILAYLDRVASEMPELTNEIINSTQTEDVRKRAFFLKITESLPADYISGNIDVFQDWLYDAPDDTSPYTVHYTNLIDELLDGGKFDPGLKMIDTLLEPQPSDPDIYEREVDGEINEWKRGGEASGLADQYTQESAIQNAWETLPSEERDDLLEILEHNLRKAIELEAEARDQDVENYYWPLAIRGSGLNNIYLKEVLLQELRNNLEEWFDDNPSDDHRLDWVNRYLNDILLFRRIGLHLLRLHPDTFSDLVRDELLEETNYDQSSIRTEFFSLLQDGFDTLTEQHRPEVLQIITSGPDEGEIREAAESHSERFTERSIDEVVEEEIDLWKLRRLWMIREDLPEPQKEQLDDLVEEYGEPDHPESQVTTKTGAVSFEGPMDIEELRDLPPREVLELCVSWEPEGEEEQDFLTEQSPQGLAEQLQKLISESPSDFVPHLDILTEADAVYIYHAFQGLEQAIDDESFFEWSPVLELCHDATHRYEDDLALEARKKTCRLISSGLSESNSGLIELHSTEVKEILLALADDPNPGSDQSQEGLIVHEDPILDSINTVRPIATRTLISYAVAKAKDEGFDGFEEEGVSGFEAEVKNKLEERLEDWSTAVYSVFGQRILNLLWIDRAFVEEELDSIFPCDADEESQERFKAAWAAFIRANQWHSDVYDMLKAHYFHSIDLIREDSFPQDNIDNKFVAHVLLSHIHTDEQLGDENSLLTHFYEEATPDLAGDAAWTLWRWGEDESDMRERWETVKKIWEWRLDTVDEDYETHTREFQWFIEWLDLVGGETDISNIETVLIETIPYIASHRRSWETIEKYLADKVDESTLPGIRVYKKLIDHSELPDYLDFGDESWKILETAFSTGGQPAEIARGLTETVAKNEPEFLKLLEENRLRD